MIAVVLWHWNSENGAAETQKTYGFRFEAVTSRSELGSGRPGLKRP